MSRLFPLRLFESATLLWAGALPFAAFGAGARGAALSLFSLFVYGIGMAVCHQIPARSFSWSGVPWPVCARCTGIYVGAAVAVASGFLMPARAPFPPRRGRLLVAAGAAPALLSLLYEWGSGQVPSNLTRAATGVVLGAAVALVLAALLGDWPSRPRSAADVR